MSADDSSASDRPARDGVSQSSSPSVAELVARAARRLAVAGVDSPRLSAELLAAEALGVSRLGLIMQARSVPDPERSAIFEALVSRRESGEPVAYLLGEREFFGLAFHVTPDVLIPRPETEHIVEQAQAAFAPNASVRFVDFGTGSGCLAVTLTHEFSRFSGIALDISPAALDVARGNAQTHGVSSRIVFVRADFMQSVLRPAAFDLAVANPPYVSEAEYGEIPHEVRDFEPRLALVSPENGLRHLAGLLPVVARSLKAGGRLLCEVGAGQGKAARSLAANPSLELEAVEILKDYAGLDRILSAVRRG